MRSEQEMFDLILNTAREDKRIRAVYMNGSRTNPNAPKDIFQDYDIVYVVRDTRPFIEDWHGSTALAKGSICSIRSGTICSAVR